MLPYITDNTEEFYLRDIDKAVVDHVVERLCMVVLERLKDYNIQGLKDIYKVWGQAEGNDVIVFAILDEFPSIVGSITI